MSKATLGPWTWEQREHGRGPRRVTDASGGLVCETHRDNAALIAAAPELRDVLRDDYLPMLESYCSTADGDDPGHLALKRARALLGRLE